MAPSVPEEQLGRWGVNSVIESTAVVTKVHPGSLSPTNMGFQRGEIHPALTCDRLTHRVSAVLFRGLNSKLSRRIRIRIASVATSLLSKTIPPLWFWPLPSEHSLSLGGWS